MLKLGTVTEWKKLLILDPKPATHSLEIGFASFKVYFFSSTALETSYWSPRLPLNTSLQTDKIIFTNKHNV